MGANLFYGVQKVYELDSGTGRKSSSGGSETVRRLHPDLLHAIEKDMAIVVPMKGERLKLLWGVLYGIPHNCLIIAISNSERAPIDRYQIEVDSIDRYCHYTRKTIVMVHQRDPAIAEALRDGGYPELLDEEGLVRDGKAEGMIAATLLAKAMGRKYIGFIDADNYFPGSVHEYVRLYAAGFAMKQSDLSMVRIAWHSKPKIVESRLFFAKYGRTSVITNHFLNTLLGTYTGFETEVIRTGNAGEHAMTMDLAMTLGYASGYAIEPYHLIYMLERFGGISQDLDSDTIRRHVEVFQIESRNPHLHEGKGEEHVERMIFSALQVIYHSPVAPQSLKEEILEELRRRGSLGKNEELPRRTYYPALSKVNMDVFVKRLENEKYAVHFENGSTPGKRRKKGTRTKTRK